MLKRIPNITTYLLFFVVVVFSLFTIGGISTTYAMPDPGSIGEVVPPDPTINDADTFIYVPKDPEDSPETRLITEPLDWVTIGANIIVGAVIAVSIIFIVYSGILFTTSRGDPKALDKARKSFTYAIVALIGAAGSLSALYVILNLLGLGDIGP
jgi:hypothetical protein